MLLGILVGAALSLGTDQVLHVLKVYPPWGQALHDPGLNLLALSYRCVFNIVGFYGIAQLAPRNPMRHVLGGSGDRVPPERGPRGRRTQGGPEQARSDEPMKPKAQQSRSHP